MKKIVTLLVVAALAVGCCSQCRLRAKYTKPLEGTVWHLVKMGGESVTLPEDSFNIILNENNLGGRGACNSLLGQYVKVLSQTTHYDIDYDMLMLMSDGTILAVFKAQQPK